jgi:hypothetical protein
MSFFTIPNPPKPCCPGLTITSHYGTVLFLLKGAHILRARA